MNILALANSPSFERHLGNALAASVRPEMCRSARALEERCRKREVIVLIHGRSVGDDLDGILRALQTHPGAIVGVAADRPLLEEMLHLSSYSVQAYFNSYMGAVHYAQLVRMLSSGQTWFVPQLLTQALGLARRSVEATAASMDLAALTRREREIALDVAQGLSNKRIANGRSISERTVKTHLTRIFKKLQVSDRTTLAVRVNGTNH